MTTLHKVQVLTIYKLTSSKLVMIIYGIKKKLKNPKSYVFRITLWSKFYFAVKINLYAIGSMTNLLQITNFDVLQTAKHFWKK